MQKINGFRETSCFLLRFYLEPPSYNLPHRNGGEKGVVIKIRTKLASVIDMRVIALIKWPLH